MPASFTVVAAYAAAVNPLLGTWVTTPPHPGVAALAAPTMTITPDAIVFGSGRREVGTAPIAGFDRAGDALLVRTRFGGTYRFRFTGDGRLCRIATGNVDAECFHRGRRARSSSRA